MDNCTNRRGIAGVMAGESAVAGYISVILRAIETAQNDPAQLRLVIYDIARMGLGKQLLKNYQEIGSAGLQQQLSHLERAIKEVEILSRLESNLIPYDGNVPLIEPPASPADSAALVVRDLDDPVEADEHERDDAAVVLNPVPPGIYTRDAEFLRPVHIWEAASPAAEESRAADRLRNFGWPVAALMAIAILGVMMLRPAYLSKINALPPAPVAQSAATQMPPNAASAPAPSLGFPLPSIYGVYAVSAGKLYELQTLAMKVPDPRVSISAMISSPSPLTIPNGKLEFIVFRRDLTSSAPDTASIRVVAQVMREMKFAATGPPKYLTVNGEWAVRSKSYQFGVAPLNGHPEMVMLRSGDSGFSFPSGRYVLLFKGEGYDFNVAGPITDSAHCLERTDAVGGMVYSECPQSR